MTKMTQLSDPELRRAMVRVSSELGISLQNALRAVRVHGGGGARTWQEAASRAIRLYSGPASLPAEDAPVLPPAQDPPPMVVERVPACKKCREPFDPGDRSFEGKAQQKNTPFCRGCVSRCHDSEIADHWCRVDEWRHREGPDDV